MTQAYVGIGSNIDRESNIASGVAALERQFGALLVSSIYESAPVGFEGDPFYNLVAGFDTDLDIPSVGRALRDIELAHGRPADSRKFTSRQLDLDLLLYGDSVIDDGELLLPRKDIDIYPFVLEPLAEIAPAGIHPVKHLSYAQLWRQMVDTGVPDRRIIPYSSGSINPP